MAKTSTEVAAMTRSGELRYRVQAGLTRKINFVRGESQAGMSAERIAKRQALAVALVQHVQAYIEPLARLLCADETLQDLCTFTGSGENTVANTTPIGDDKVIYHCDAQFDLLAGVLTTEL